MQMHLLIVFFVVIIYMAPGDVLLHGRFEQCYKFTKATYYRWVFELFIVLCSDMISVRFPGMFKNDVVKRISRLQKKY